MPNHSCSFSGGCRWSIGWWQHGINETLEPWKVLSQSSETSLEFWHGQELADLISISSVHSTILSFQLKRTRQTEIQYVCHRKENQPEKLHRIVVAESITSIFRTTEITHIHLNICHIHVDHDNISIHTTVGRCGCRIFSLNLI